MQSVATKTKSRKTVAPKIAAPTSANSKDMVYTSKVAYRAAELAARLQRFAEKIEAKPDGDDTKSMRDLVMKLWGAERDIEQVGVFSLIEVLNDAEELIVYANGNAADYGASTPSEWVDPVLAELRSALPLEAGNLTRKDVEDALQTLALPSSERRGKGVAAKWSVIVKLARKARLGVFEEQSLPRQWREWQRRARRPGF